MYTLKVQNDRNEILSLTDNKNFIVEKINGLSPMPAEISTTSAVGYDGSIYTNGRCDKRNITLSVIPRGNIETSRQMLYRYFVPKKSVRLFFTNTNRDVYIDCEVETVEIDLFSPIQTADISLICPQPYFIRNEETSHTMVMGEDNKYSLSLTGGEAESGVIFDLDITDTSGLLYLVFENETTGQKMRFTNRLGIVGEVTIHIDTNPGEKQAYYTDFEGKHNQIPFLDITNGWITLAPGSNVFKVYSSNLTSLFLADVTLTANRYYIGV